MLSVTVATILAMIPEINLNRSAKVLLKNRDIRGAGFYVDPAERTRGA